ncbi:MAG: winged helix-turn-helix domain-containing protein [Streptosporangiaceae bacterium]
MARGPERPGERVERDLRERIAAGEWRPGEALPTVAALSEHYGVSPGVVQRVLKRLQEDGLVNVVARWGTFRA